jgi:DNA-binding MarR family transcriptional regulator
MSSTPGWPSRVSRAALTKQSVGEVADQLQQLGYVERVPDPDDRRAKLIRLTDRGRQAHAAARHILSDIERRWGQRHGDERIATLRTVLEDILLEEPSAARILHLA